MINDRERDNVSGKKIEKGMKERNTFILILDKIKLDILVLDTRY